MTTSPKAVSARPKRAKTATAAAPGVKAKLKGSKRAKDSATNVVIAKELAPAVALALLDKTEQPKGAPAPALECLAAGAVASESAGKVRLQLLFENGAVLPVEMSAEAGAALSKGLAEELPSK